MKPVSRILVALSAAILLGLLPAALAQAPVTAPAGSNGICKDGTYSTAATKDGACRGHKGVQTWYNAATATKKGAPAGAAAPASIPAAAAPAASATRGDVHPQSQPAQPQAPAPSATHGAVAPQAPPASQQPSQPAAAAKPGISAERAKLASMQPAAGGGPGLVWLNGSSKVYHCPGSEFYGKTKTGSYLPEADAKAKGAHADHNKPCS